MTPVLNLSKLRPSGTPSPSPTIQPQPQHLNLNTPDLELALVIVCLALLAISAWGPGIEQPAHYHAFADRRQLFGVPNLMDVLSNLAFAALGAVGAWRTWRMPQGMPSPVQQNLAGLFFTGLIVTAFCSGWYHLQPDDVGLAVDRYGMTIAFAGLLGLAASTRVSERAGQWLALAVLVCGAWSIRISFADGNVLPWAVLQFGGMALMLGLGCMRPREGALPVSWITVILVYALAKLLEHADAQVYQLTNEWVSGHTLKHVVASLAALPILAALAPMTRAGRPLESGAREATVVAKR